MLVYVNADKRGTIRKLIEVKFLSETETTIRVRTEDGRTIVRKKNRDLEGCEKEKSST